MKSPSKQLFLVLSLGTFATASLSVPSAFGEKSARSAPTDADIFRLRGFEERLVPIGGHTTPGENIALSKAIGLYVKRSDRDDGSALLHFLREFPQSRWRVAILVNLGIRYRETGWFLKALEAWKEAWELSKYEKSQLGKPLADRAIGELAELNTGLGRKESIERILKEVRGRPLIGPATEQITAASEGLWMMRHEPENVFKCGQFALARIAACNATQAADRQKILSAQSTDRGTSLEQLWRLSGEAGLHYQMAKRESGSEIITPSIVNWKTNHFAALVREDLGKFLVKDPTSKEDLLVSKAALDAETSGYFLIPDGPLPRGWSHVSATEGSGVWGSGGTRWHERRGTKPWDDKAKKCEAGIGMATYNFHTQLVSLNIVDTPVGYTPPRGPDMHFTVTYNQRERGEAGITVTSNFGYKTWLCNWNVYLVRPAYDEGWPVQVHVSGGGAETHFRPSPDPLPDPQSGAVLTKAVNSSTGLEYYTRALPDGSRQLFELQDNDFFDRHFYMTKWIDSKGDMLLFHYEDFRLLTVTDALGKVTNIEHLSDDPENIPDYYRIKKVTDPFGRFAEFEYNGDGQLWKIHDAIGIVSEFHYEAPASDFVDRMTTPYGTTIFSHPPSALEIGTDDPPNARIIQAVDAATGATERVEFGHLAPGIEAEETVLPVVPNITIANGLFHVRNSYYWDKKATAMYPPQNGVYDYTKAKVIHWLHSGDEETLSNIKEREKMPLENAVHYFYPQQFNGTHFEGTSGFPSNVARVLGDGTTQLWQYEHDNPYHKLTKSTDPKGRVTSYQYAANGIDLIAVFQRNLYGQGLDPDGENADQIFGCTYTDTESHLLHVITDAAGQPTTYTYTVSKQLETVTNARNETTTYGYGDGTLGKPIGYVTSISSPVINNSAAVTSFTYDNANRVQKIKSSPDNYELIIEYDALDRRTKITYPDTTTEEFSYTDSERGMTLDLTASKDRLNRWTFRHYNSFRQMDSITDPLLRTTLYGWCTCGSLESIRDPEHQITTFNRDLQSRVYQKVFADSTTINYLFEGQTAPNTAGATSRLKSSTDALNRRTNYLYFIDDNISQVSYTDASGNPLSPPTPSVSYTYDDNYNRIWKMNDGTGQTIYAYNAIASSPALGAGRLRRVDGPLASDPITYTYDELGRVRSQSIGGLAETVNYDELGRLTTTENDVLGSFGREYYGVTPRLQRLTGPTRPEVNYAYFENDHDRRLQTIQNLFGHVNISQFDYDYDPEGQLKSWGKVLDTTASGLWFEYDDARQLQSARNALNINTATEKLDYDYDDAGNRIYDRNYNPNGVTGNGVSNTYGINVLNQVESGTVAAGGVSLEPQAFVYDAVGNMSSDGAGKTFEWDAANRLIAINYISTGNRTEFAYDGLGRRVKITEYGPGMTADIEPVDANYTTFVAGKFVLPSGGFTVTLQGLNPFGSDSTMLVDSVKLNSLLMANGSFENPPNVNNYVIDPTGVGWSFSGTAGVTANGGTYGNPSTTAGTQAAFIRNYGSVSQSLSLAAGTYKLELKAAQRSGNETSQRLRVIFRSSAAVVSRKTFVWCGNQICQERDETGAVTKRFFGEGEQRIGGNDAGNYFYTRDHLGSIREVTDSNGEVKAQYDYDPYGNRVVLSGQMDTDFGYTGHYHHAPSGLNLTLYRAYNPTLGRWISRDPIGEGGGINLYGYVANDPVNDIDPLGLLTVVAVGAATPSNPFGHVSIGVSGSGVYSFGTTNASGVATPLGSSFTEFLQDQARYRNTDVYFIDTTQAQESAILDYLKSLDPTLPEVPGKDSNDTCATRVNDAMSRGNLPNLSQAFMPFFNFGLTSRFPGSTAYSAAVYSRGFVVQIEQGSSYSYGAPFTYINPR